MKFDIWPFLQNPSKGIQVPLNLTRITGTLHKDQCTFVSRSVLLRMRTVSNKSCRKIRNTHFVFNNIFPKVVPYMRHVQKYGKARQTTDDNIIRSRRFACWINKATDTHSECVIPMAFRSNNGFANVTLIHILPVLYQISGNIICGFVASNCLHTF